MLVVRRQKWDKKNNTTYFFVSLFPLKEEITDGNYLADNLVPRMLFSYNNVVLTELLQKVGKDDIIIKKSLKDLDVKKWAYQDQDKARKEGITLKKGKKNSLGMD